MPEQPAAVMAPIQAASAERIPATAAAMARNMVGVPYKWGGHSPRGFDCSGLIYYAYGSQGVRIPRTAAQQMASTVQVSLHEARPGDLVFFRGNSRGGHVGILIGGDQFVHAPSRGKRVAVGSLSTPWYRDNLIRAGRLALRR